MKARLAYLEQMNCLFEFIILVKLVCNPACPNRERREEVVIDG